MAVVYRAVQPNLGRSVAIKVLLPSLTRDPSFLSRFRHEARLIAGLMHPNILPVYDYGESDGLVYIAMGYAAGGTLRQKMTERLSLAGTVRLVGQVADALDHAHGRGVVHQDV